MVVRCFLVKMIVFSLTRIETQSSWKIIKVIKITKSNIINKQRTIWKNYYHFAWWEWWPWRPWLSQQNYSLLTKQRSYACPVCRWLWAILILVYGRHTTVLPMEPLAIGPTTRNLWMVSCVSMERLIVGWVQIVLFWNQSSLWQMSRHGKVTTPANSNKVLLGQSQTSRLRAGWRGKLPGAVPT